MNIFSIYQKKIIIILRKLSKKKLIKIPANISGVVVELPPKNQKADISCNAALILAKKPNLPVLIPIIGIPMFFT